MTRSSRRPFILRLESERTRELLRVVAEHHGMAMHELAAELIERELRVLALGLESGPSGTIEALRSYRAEARGEAWAASADAEAQPEVPMLHRRRLDEDPFGVARAFEARRGE